MDESGNSFYNKSLMMEILPMWMNFNALHTCYFRNDDVLEHQSINHFYLILTLDRRSYTPESPKKCPDFRKVHYDGLFSKMFTFRTLAADWALSLRDCSSGAGFSSVEYGYVKSECTLSFMQNSVIEDLLMIVSSNPGDAVSSLLITAELYTEEGG